MATIVFGVDNRYVDPMLVAMTSLAFSGGISGENAAIGVLGYELGDDQRDRILRVGEALGHDVEVIAVDGDLSRFPVTHWISPAAYSRLHLADACRGASTVVYLDCDLVAVRPITELLTACDGAIAAVRDMSNPVLEGGEALPGFERLGIPGSREYFNSGVLQVDVAEWAARDIARRCAEFLIEHPDHVQFWDQDALNVVIDDAWKRLPLEFNALPLSLYQPKLQSAYKWEHVMPLADALAVEQRARILHFAGPYKPWAPGFPDHPVRLRYDTYRARLAKIEASW